MSRRTQQSLCGSDIGSQMAEQLGNRAINQRVRFLAVQNDVVSLGEALFASGGNVPVLTVSRSG